MASNMGTAPFIIEIDALHDNSALDSPQPEEGKMGMVEQHSSCVESDDESSMRQDHKDSLNRYLKVQGPNKNKDHFLSPDDGKLVLLRVQRVNKAVANTGSLTASWSEPLEPNPLVQAWKWFRDSPRSILYWTYNDFLLEKNKFEGSSQSSAGVNSSNTSDIYWKYPIACLLLTLTALFGNFEGKTYPGGRYPPVRYKYFSYYGEKEKNRVKSKLVSSTSPQNPNSSSTNHKQLPQNDYTVNDGVAVFKRSVRPRKLCVLNNNVRDGYEIIDLVQLDKEGQSDEVGEYVFVSYTRKQFHTYSSEAMEDWEGIDPQDSRNMKIRKFMYATFEEDVKRLCHIGKLAARDAGVNAFWIDILCLSDADKMDAHRICDVARGALKMVIAIQDKVEDRAFGRCTVDTGENQSEVTENSDANRDNRLDVYNTRHSGIGNDLNKNVKAMLYNWGSRVWTLPELLLAPTSGDFEIYLAKDDIKHIDTIPKRSMVARAYSEHDGALVRQLIDHFEGSLQLTPIELLTIGLECLVSRETSPYMKADQIYALMTLARRRLIPDDKDTPFDAFAQLSLLNDSNLLLERLICTLPEKRGGPWHNLDDYWGAKLWDIEPTVQVAAVASDKTVILDGAFGATINWGELKKVSFLKRKTIWRSIGAFIVRFAPGWLIVAIILLVTLGQPVPVGYDYRTYQRIYQTNPMIGFGIFFFLIAFFAVAILPHAMLSLYGGKFWSTQALLFGLEGKANLMELEKQLFGFSQGRLQWSTSGSTQSRHDLKLEAGGSKWVQNECEAHDPEVTELEVFQGKDGETPDADRVFTVVDTYSMTATLIRAVHPPSVALVCGQEGGMRRTLLCSYDYKTQTFHRETVIRMPTKVLDRMDRVDKFRFSMFNMPLAITPKGTVKSNIPVV